jgi:SAM-dependent methyltransferase
VSIRSPRPQGDYPGQELELFREARNWKAYFSSCLVPYLQGDILEVGAGIAGTTRVLCDGTQRSWVCLEPDRSMATAIEQLIARGELPACCRLVTGDVRTLSPTACFDAVLYIDVLEHIEDDAGELSLVCEHLKPGGHLLVLAPAHPSLFSCFDQAIGHYRRYSKRTLTDTAPPALEPVDLRYLDSVGFLASLANRLLLKQSLPTVGQIQFWDRSMVPVSRWLDRVLRYRMGKSILGVWRKPGLPVAPPQHATGR